MLQVTIDTEQLQELINDAVDQAIKRHDVQNTLPPLLTRREFMELMQIGESKCAELFHRQDFPVNREFGHPRVDTALLIDWIHRHSNWVEENASPQAPFRVI